LVWSGQWFQAAGLHCSDGMMTEGQVHACFLPDLTPAQMLELGVFGGSYFVDGGWGELPPQVAKQG
jgi:hypothetical protein